MIIAIHRKKVKPIVNSKPSGDEIALFPVGLAAEA
jgi:hypothetical protein